jgi:uncharacterized protein YoaH (UPF0181 family)
MPARIELSTIHENYGFDAPKSGLKNRHGRFRDSDLLRHLFETTVARYMAEGLVGGEGFAIDASLIRADVNRQHAVGRPEQLPDEATSHAVREYLAVLCAAPTTSSWPS